MEPLAVVSRVIADAAVGRNCAAPVCDHPAQPRVRTYMNVIQNDAFFQVGALFDPHSATND
jgi:hypothetical protein